MDDPNTPPEGASGTRQPPMLSRLFQAVQPRLVATIGASAGLLVLAVIPLFVSFSSSQIKSIFDQFTGGCVLVLHKTQAPYGQIYVTGRIAGTMPEKIPLIFEGRDALLNTIDFDDAYRLDQVREPDDLTFHPLAQSICPGPLCELDGDRLNRVVQIMLTDIRPEFTYRFRVRLLPSSPATVPSPGNLKVYALYDRGFKGQVCRVEPQRWFNFWVWATPLKKAALFIFVIVVGGLLLKWARTWERSRK